MPEFVDTFRSHAASSPVLLALALSGLGFLALRGRQIAGAFLLAPMAWLSLAALAVYIAVAAWYASDARYFDAAEPTIPIIGWLFTLGQPIYHDAGSAERYAHIYGPLAFIAHGVVLRLAGPSIEASKWLGAGCGLASLAATFLVLTTATTRRRALVLTGSCALVYLAFRNYTFWTRPEPLQLLAVSAGLLAAVRAGGVGAAVGVGLATGVLVNLKITGPLYALPLLALLGGRLGVKAVVVAAITGGAAAAAPFLLPNVSLEAYLAWLRLSAGNGLGLSALHQNVEWAAFLMLPVLIIGVGARPHPGPAHASRTHWIAGALLAGVCGIAIAASKPGAGPYHLLPFVPIIAHRVAVELGEREVLAGSRWAAPAAAAWLLAAGLIALAQQASFISIVAASHGGEERRDIRAYLDAHPTETVQMAYSGYDRPTFARPDLTFRSGLYLIDGPAVQEHQLSGRALPPATLDAIRTCRAAVWLAPRDTEPFAGPNRYPAMAQAPIFPEAFRQAFQSAYARVDHTRYFDVWRCRTASQ